MFYQGIRVPRTGWGAAIVGYLDEVRFVNFHRLDRLQLARVEIVPRTFLFPVDDQRWFHPQAVAYLTRVFESLSRISSEIGQDR